MGDSECDFKHIRVPRAILSLPPFPPAFPSCLLSFADDTLFIVELEVPSSDRCKRRGPRFWTSGRRPRHRACLASGSAARLLPSIWPDPRGGLAIVRREPLMGNSRETPPRSFTA